MAFHRRRNHYYSRLRSMLSLISAVSGVLLGFLGLISIFAPSPIKLAWIPILDLLPTRKEALDWMVKKGKGWMMQLLAVTCLSLAAKMEETQVPLCLDLQASMPFSFIDQFLNKIKDEETTVVDTSLIMKSIQIILSTTRGIEFLEFKPCEIAAAVAIVVLW